MNGKMAELVTKFTRTMWPCVAALVLYVITVTSALDCQSVKNVYSSRGATFNRKDIPLAPLSGEHLQYCHHGNNGLTCCTREVENKLYQHSRDDYDILLADSTTSIRHIFITKTAKFDEFFTELLENGRKDFHSMFVRTYGLLYQQNAHIFNDLFKDLRSYYQGGNINLLDALENFFATLFQRMFQLLNAQYELDQSYLGCVANTMDKLQPFGDVPQKFSQQLKRSFVAARTFMQGLAIGRDVILQVGKIQPSESCWQSLMKMMYCSYCSALPTTKPCNNYCLNVMKGCLAYQAELNTEWNRYIDELIKVANRLMTSFNIEQVVDPMDVKISEAIMNLQEGSEKIRQRVFTSCGQPRFKGRKKRKADYEEYAYGNWRYKPAVGTSGGMARPTTAAGTNLERLVSDIVKQVEVTKDFWTLLPYTLCNHEQFAFVARNGTEGDCWNGEHRGRYMHDVTQDGISAQEHNPEVTIDPKRHNVIVQQQIRRLKLIHSKLSNAHLGHDVDWIDMADTIGDTMVDVGSGSGSGSGAGQYDDDGEGSGYTFHEDSTTRRVNHHHHTNPPVTSTSKMPPTPVEVRPQGGATAKTSSVVALVMLTAMTAFIQNIL